MEKVLWRIELSKVVCEASAGDFSLDVAPQSRRPAEVDSDQMETLTENNQHYTTWEIANILKISKSKKLLVKMKNMSFILWKKLNRLFGQPNGIFISLKIFCYFRVSTVSVEKSAVIFIVLPLKAMHLFSFGIFSSLIMMCLSVVFFVIIFWVWILIFVFVLFFHMVISNLHTGKFIDILFYHFLY